MTRGGRTGPPQPAPVLRATRSHGGEAAVPHGNYAAAREILHNGSPACARFSQLHANVYVRCLLHNPAAVYEEAQGHLTVQWTTRIFISCCFVLMQRAADASVCAFPRAAETLLGFLQRVIVYTWFL